MWSVVKKRRSAQFQIQQMAFMIIALFIFFAIAGIFMLNISLGGLKEDAQELKADKAISFLATIPQMTEFTYGGNCINCLDRDKLRVFHNHSTEYKEFFPLDSLKAIRVYPEPTNFLPDGNPECPSTDCLVLFNSTNSSIQEYATFVPVCEKSRALGMISEQCEVWKLVGGVKFLE
jgi:hypothetical protein